MYMHVCLYLSDAFIYFVNSYFISFSVAPDGRINLLVKSKCM